MSPLIDFDKSQPHSFCGTTMLGTRRRPGEADIGCDEPVFFDRPWSDLRNVAIRCADCLSVFCPECAKEHFREAHRTEVESLKLANGRLERERDDARYSRDAAEAEVAKLRERLGEP